MFARGSVLAVIAAGATLVNGIANGTGISRVPIVTPAPVGESHPTGCGNYCVEEHAVISGMTTRITYLCPPPVQTVHVTETVVVTVHDSVKQSHVTPSHDSVKQPPVTPTAHTIDGTTTMVFTSTSTAYLTHTLHGKPSTAANFTSSKVSASFSVPPVVPSKSSHALTTTHMAPTSRTYPHFPVRPSTGTLGWVLTDPLHPSFSSGVGGIWQNATSSTKPLVTTTMSVESFMTIHTSNSVSSSLSGLHPNPTPIPGFPTLTLASTGAATIPSDLHPKPTPIPGLSKSTHASTVVAASSAGYSTVISHSLPPVGHPMPTVFSSKALPAGNSSKTITISKTASLSSISDIEVFPTVTPDHNSTTVRPSKSSGTSTITDMESFPTIVSETGFISLPPDSELFSTIFDGASDTQILTDGTFLSAPASTAGPYLAKARRDSKVVMNVTVTDLHITTVVTTLPPHSTVPSGGTLKPTSSDAKETKTPTAAYPGASTEALKGVAGHFGPGSTLAIALSLLTVIIV